MFFDPFGALALENRLSLSVQQVFIISRRNLTTRIILIKNYKEHWYFILWQLICKIDQRLLIAAIIVGFEKMQRTYVVVWLWGKEDIRAVPSIDRCCSINLCHVLITWGPFWYINDHDSSLIISVTLSND
jgi:hypothetical protein